MGKKHANGNPLTVRRITNDFDRWLALWPKRISAAELAEVCAYVEITARARRVRAEADAEKIQEAEPEA